MTGGLSLVPPLVSGCCSRAVLPGITIPVLLIAGDRDRFFPRKVIEETAALTSNCTLILHENQGHLDVANDPRTAWEVLRYASTPTTTPVTQPPD